MTAKAITPIRADERWNEGSVRYSICTIITRPAEYAEMIETFRLRGFQEPDCEFLYLDNSKGNVFDAYRGNNLFLNVARGVYVILCHQDVVLLEDGRPKLDALIQELDRLDANWAVCGNAGGEYPGQLAIRISDPHGSNQSHGRFPAKVRALDENFIVVRREANLAVSHDLAGFHFYGADICIIADILGWNSYVIDFHLRHKSPGSSDQNFLSVREDLIRKYRHAIRSRWIVTTCSIFFLSGFPALGRVLSSRIGTGIARFVGRNVSRVFKSRE